MFLKHTKIIKDLNLNTYTPAHYYISAFGSGERPKCKIAEILEITTTQDLEYYLTTHTHSATTFRGTRNNANIVGTWSFLCFDFDDTHTVENVIEQVKHMHCFIGASRNHRKEKNGVVRDRFHVYIKLKNAITSGKQYLAAVETIKQINGWKTDPSADKAGRIWFPCREILFRNTEGEEFNPSEIDLDRIDVKLLISNPRKYWIEGVGKPSLRTMMFLENGAPDGEWNNELMLACKDMHAQGYMASDLEEYLTDRTTGATEQLDSNDRATIEAEWRREVVFERRSWDEKKVTRDKVTSDKKIAVLSPLGCRNSAASGGEGKALPPQNLEGRESTEPPEQGEGGGIGERTLSSVVAELANNFITKYQKADTFLPYRIKSAQDKVLELYTNEQSFDVLLQTIVEMPEAVYTVWDGRTRRYKEKRLLFDDVKKIFFRTPSIQLPYEPLAFCFKEDDLWSMHKLDFAIEQGGHDAWDEFLGRLDYPRQFMAWVWSCFELKSKSRQALWLYGKNSRDGKSTTMKVLAECFGRAAAALNATQLGGDSKFVTSSFYGKRFVVYPDCKKLAFPKMEFFRSVTSGDLVPVEFKGKPSFMAPIYVKLAISSNGMPELGDHDADKSRILLIQISESKVKDDAEWEERLKAELGYFLYDCREAYKELSPKHGIIKTTEEQKSVLNILGKESVLEFEDLFDKHFKETDYTEYVMYSDLFKIMREENLKKYDRAQFINYLKNSKNISMNSTRKFRGMSLKNTETSDLRAIYGD